MNNLEEMIGLAWYKGAEDSPWVLTLEDKHEEKRETTLGEKGYASAGPVLLKSLEYMESKISRYPIRYDMRRVKDIHPRQFSTKLLKGKIVHVEAPVSFQKELNRSFVQTPFVPFEDKVDYIEEGSFFVSATTENKIMTQQTRRSRSTVDKQVKLLSEYAPNTHVFWLFSDPKNVKVVNSTTLDIYIDAYNWPEGYAVPGKIGKQNILESGRTVRVELLGAQGFSLNNNTNIDAAKRYSIYKRDGADITYYPSILSNIEREARNYLEELIKTKGIIAFSLQYTIDEGTPIDNNGNLLSVMYGTQFNNFNELSASITSKSFSGVNINKSLLKEYYSGNDKVKKEYKHAKDLPLVEFVNQSEGVANQGISIALWVEESGVQIPPESTDLLEEGNITSEDELVDKVIKDIVEKDDFNKSDYYVEGYINNDLSFVPPNDDRLESGEIYNTYDESQFEGIPENERAGTLPYEYTHKVRIGDVMLEVPPLSIRATKQQANEHVSTLRSRNAMHKGVGTSRQTLTLDLYFHDLENINGHKRYAYTKDNGRQVFYYMDGLRTLLAQFIKSPFVPIDNEYINESLGVKNVAMQNIHTQTVEGFPEALMVTLVLEDFDVSPYLMGETDLGMVMNYPLYRWYYQQSLQPPQSGFSTKTYLPEIERLDNNFYFELANESYLNNRTDIINEFNALQTPSELKRTLEQKAKEENSSSKKETKTMSYIDNALRTYNRYIEYYGSLPGDKKKKYSITTLPVVTGPKNKNLKDGTIKEIDSKELNEALEAGRFIYGDSVNVDNAIVNLIEESARAKQGRRLSEKDNILISAYQLSDYSIINQLVFKNNLPGLLQIQLNDSSIENKIKDLLSEIKEKAKKDGLTEPGDYRSIFYNTNTYFIPAGTVYGIDFLSELSKYSKTYADKENKINTEVEEYTREYNQMVNEINISESDIPTDSFYIEGLVPIDLSVSLANNLSLVQVQAAQTPSFQYLGAQQPEVQITFSTTDAGVQQIDEIFRKVARYAKEYRTGLVSNFMAIKNPLINMFGIDAVLPNTFDISTVEGQPDQKIVTMILTGFDKTQRRQEALYSFAGGKVSTEMKELHLDNYDPQVNSLFIHEKMKNMELYPDLELPTHRELEEDLKHLNSGISKYENRTEQVYLDPDFYISTETTVRKKLSEILGDSRGTPMQFKDDTDGGGTTNVLSGQGLVVNNKVQEMVNENNEDYVDPYLEWKDYEGTSDSESSEEDSIDDDGEEKLTLESNKIHIKSSKGELRKVDKSSQGIINGLKNHKGENPDPEEVWEHLYKEVVRVFKNNPEYNDTDMSKFKNLKKSGDTDTFKRIGRAPDSAFLYNYYTLELYSKNWLKNGISEEIGFFEKYKLEGSKEVFTLNPFKSVNPVKVLKESFTEIKRASNKYMVPNAEKLRVFMYMKSVLEMESNWSQFQEDGSPFISYSEGDGQPIKVGIMGAPLAGANSRTVNLLATNWKYNITYSVENMKKTYDNAISNQYGDFHGRALDWAVASHSATQLPPILISRDKAHDKPQGKGKLLIAPEANDYFQRFSSYYRKITSSISNGSPLAIFSAKDTVLREKMAEITGITEEEATEFIEEAFVLESNNFDQYSLEDKLKLMYVDMQQHNQVGRFVRAFPSFSLMLIDEGKWFQNFRTWDNFYGYNALHSIDVYKSRKIAADTAVISMSNMYGNLSSSHGSQSNPDLRMPSFFSSQFWEHFVLGRPTDQQLEQRAEQYDQIMLQTGARVHLRMGYGADASYLPVVFNGSISEVSTDEVIEVVAQSDALELQNVISGDPEDDNLGLMNRTQEPRRTIGELMTSKGNWIKEMVNHHTSSTFFKNNPMGIAHFGSTIESEKGNRAILPGPKKEEFGESLQNVYSQNGMQTKSQWHHADGREIGRIEMTGKHIKSFFTGITTLAGKTPSFDEANVAISYYGRTVWEVIQTFALVSQDYISEVVPFEFRSTLFFGKPHWIMEYRYDSDFIYDAAREKIDRVITKTHVKTFMQAHVYNSNYNIINNNIMASEEGVYNNVIVTYDGRQAGPVQADSDIRFDKQRTISVEANILAPRMSEYFRAEDQSLIYGQSTLRDYMKDMYKGEYSIIGDPTLKPYDVVYMNDHVNDINGIHLVKAVHHSMDGEHGLISYIEPDAYVYNFDEELGELATGIFSVGKNLNVSTLSVAIKSGVSWMTTAVISKILAKAIKWGVSKSVSAVNTEIGLGVIKYSASKMFEVAGNLYQTGGTTVKLAKSIRTVKNMTELKSMVGAANSSLQGDILASAAKGATEQATFFQKQANNIQAFLNGPKTAANIQKAGGAVKNSGQFLKGVVTSKTALFVVAYAVFSLATGTIAEWWQRWKQNAEAIKVVPLIHRGKRWTALMNWHKGSVIGDDPSLRDRLFDSEFFDGDEEVNDVFGNSLFKLMNLFFS